MINKYELKYIQSFAHKKHWAQESVFIIEGPKMLQEAIKANWVIEKIYATKDWDAQLGNSGGDIEEIDDIMLSRISHLQTPNQVVALVQKKQYTLPVNYNDHFTIVLDGIQKMPSKGFLIIGNESKGIRPNLKSFITQPVSIPNFGGAESLNAAVAAGIVMSHWKMGNTKI